MIIAYFPDDFGSYFTLLGSRSHMLRIVRVSCSNRLEDPMDDNQSREEFDTGLSKIRHEIKSRLVIHGLFGSVTNVDIDPTEQGPSGSKIEIAVKGRTVGRSFDRQQIEACRLRVGGAVLSGIVSMVAEVST
jgi:hypothetical protein